MTEGQRSCAYEGCDRIPHKTSSDGHCIFHAKAEDKTVEDFRQALYKYLVKLERAKHVAYDFVGFIFVGEIDFKESFGLNVFKRVALFQNATFKGDAWFRDVTFKGKAWFSAATFERNAWFRDVTFEGDALFQNATFKGKASFIYPTFERDASFEDATFERNASFEDATFERNAWFIYATFEGDALFQNATFKGKAWFSAATFKYILFNFVRFRETASILPRAVTVGISFLNATIENSIISLLGLKEEAQVDFAGARLRNTTIRREDVKDHIKQEKSEDYRKAQDIYMLLKNNFQLSFLGLCAFGSVR